MDAEITNYINNNHIITLCGANNDSPYCFNAFYVFLEKENCLVYKSSFGTKHTQILGLNNKVAGTILPIQFNPAAISGIQFEGFVYENGKYKGIDGAAEYYARFPIATNMDGIVWLVDLTVVKLTDNGKGFGYKNTWIRV